MDKDYERIGIGVSKGNLVVNRGGCHDMFRWRIPFEPYLQASFPRR
jgi:hypothetical protein